MLPFLQKKKQTGVQVIERAPDEKDESDQGDGLKACAQDIIRALEQKDAAHLAEALRSAFQILDSEPHEEEEDDKPEPHSYSAQNEEAAE